MCSSCGPAERAAAEGGGDGRRPWSFGVHAKLRWAAVGVVLLGALVSAVLRSGSDPPRRASADRVFAADLSRQAGEARRLAGEATIVGQIPALRGLAASIQRIESRHAGFVGRGTVETDAAGEVSPQRLQDFLEVVSRHAEGDQLLGRIQLASGSDPRMRARARELERDGRRLLFELGAARQR
jgi:hypothetical protein